MKYTSVANFTKEVYPSGLSEIYMHQWNKTAWYQIMACCLFSAEPLSQPTLAYHHNDIIMSAMASQITSLTIVYSSVYSGTDQRKHQTPCHWPL